MKKLGMVSLGCPKNAADPKVAGRKLSGRLGARRCLQITGKSLDFRCVADV